MVIVNEKRKNYKSIVRKTTQELEKFYFQIYNNYNSNNTTKIKPIIAQVNSIKVELIQFKDAKVLLNKYHYLPTHNFVGRRICYKIIDQTSDELLAISIWSNTPAPSLIVRDEFIGLTNYDDRMSKICKICANNVRFLILPHIKVKNLASQIISKVIKKLKVDWKEKYGDKLLYVETFVDPSKGFKGTCYKASSWTYLGLTKGYSFHGSGYSSIKGINKMPKCNTQKMIFFRSI